MPAFSNSSGRNKPKVPPALQILKMALYMFIFIVAYRTGRSRKRDFLTAYSDRPMVVVPDGSELAVLEEGEGSPCPALPPAEELELPCPVAQPRQHAYAHQYGTQGGKPGQGSYCPPRSMEMANLHKNLGTYTMDKIFPHLHHASSMANVELFMTTQSRKDWLEPVIEGMEDGGRIHRACSEIYLTRTGGRSSQPNKCVAVARVPQGSESIVQLSHRRGTTAKMVDQYQNDYSRDYSRAEESILLAPLLERLDDLVKEFGDKLGPQIGPDGRRRTAVVMVANEGVMDLLLVKIKIRCDKSDHMNCYFKTRKSFTILELSLLSDKHGNRHLSICGFCRT